MTRLRYAPRPQETICTDCHGPSIRLDGPLLCVFPYKCCSRRPGIESAGSAPRKTNLGSLVHLESMATEEIINGTNVAEFRELVEQVRKDPAKAERNPKIVAQWLGGGRGPFLGGGVDLPSGR